MRSAVTAAERTLASAGVPSPAADARSLACFALGVDNLLMVEDVPDSFESAYAELIGRRAAREPLQLIVGRVWFRHIDFAVEAGVFIPRPETELVAGAAIDAARDALAASGSEGGSVRVVDLCTGSGAIALSVAAEVPAAQVIAVEFDEHAIDLAERNRTALDLQNLVIRKGDVTAEPLPELVGSVDVVVSNPPYVPDDPPISEPEVLRYDPPAALYGLGVDGFALPRQVIRMAGALLRPGGVLVMEHDLTQGEIARDTAVACGFDSACTYIDLAGRDRYTVARRVSGAADRPRG